MGIPAAGDDLILSALLKYRVLTSGQIAWLTGRSAAVIRRRMRKYLIAELKAVTALTGGGVADQVAYALSKSGFELMAARAGLDPKRMPFSSKPPSGPGSLFYRHTKLSNDLAIALSVACSKPESPVSLVQAIPEWEMNLDPAKRRSKNPSDRFVLCEKLEDLDEPQHHHILRPDALYVLAPRQDPALRVAAYLEADRATVSGRVISEKIQCYFHLFVRQGFRRYGAVTMRLLFVVGSTTTEQRLDSIRAAHLEFCQRNKARHERFCRERLAAVPDSARPALEARLPPISVFENCLRLCRREDFVDADILTDPIWRTASGDRVPFFRGHPTRP